MRKAAFLLSVLLVLALVLGACAQADEEGALTEEPTLDVETTGIPESDAEVTETLEAIDTPMLTETPLVEATQELTVAVTETPLATEVVGTTTAPVLPGTGITDPARVSNLLDFPIQNANGDELGSVEDMVIDLSASQVQYVILASGGFLGIGEQLVPIPYSAVSVNPECGVAGADLGTEAGTGTTGAAGGTETPGVAGTPGGDTGTGTGTPAGDDAGTGTGTGTPAAGVTGTAAPETDTDLLGANCFFLANIDDEVIENAPNVDLDEIPDVSTLDWDTEFRTYWEDQGFTDFGDTTGDDQTGTTGAQTTGTPAATTQTPGGQQATGTPGAAGGTATTQTPGAGAGAAAGDTLDRVVLATDLMNYTLQGANAESFGEVEDIIIDVDTGRVLYILFSSGEDLGLDEERLIPVPPQSLALGAEDEQAFQLGENQDASELLTTAPGFTWEDLPNFSTEGWETELQDFWGGDETP